MMVKLGDICEILDNKRVPITAKDREKGIYPYYGANGIQDYVSDYIFDDELVLLAEDGGNFGSKEKPIAYRVSGKCWVNNHAHVLKPKQGLDVDYLCYSLMFYDVSNLINGATRQKLTQTDMRKMEIPLPPLEEQYKITKTLDKVSDLIAKRKQQLEKLDLLVKSKFVEMFGDPSTNPYKWSKKYFDEISDVITDGEHATPKRSQKGIYLLSARNILNHYIQVDDVDYIDEDEYNRISKRIVPNVGDVLISCSGSIGRCCVVPENFKFQMVRSVALIRFKECINPVFAEWLIVSDELQRQVFQSSTQSSQANLFQNKIKKLYAYVPPIELQNQFADFVKQTEKTRNIINQSLEKIEILKKALMQEYFM